MILPWTDVGPPTQLPPAQLADRLVRSWTAETGELPPRNVAELLLAQVLLETNWSRSMQRFNWGNVTAGRSWPGDAWRPSWFELTPESSERDQALHELMLQNRAPSSFRAYPSHDAGSRDYIRVVNRGFAPMVAAANTGDPEVFAAAVRSTRYCPDCGASFGRSMRVLQTQIRHAGWLSSLPSSPSAIESRSKLIATVTTAMVVAAASGYGALALLRKRAV